MACQTTFERFEMKYLLNPQQKALVLEAMRPYMALDQYGRSTIRNLYLDTENFRLIRRSLEKPAYKEKIRIRSYQPAGPEDPVFVELKKKYRSVVYKRRVVLPQWQAADSFARGTALPVDSQIGAEIEYFRRFYGHLQPVVFLSYEREAFFPLDGGDFRVTMDENILYRTGQLQLDGPVYGAPLLGAGQTLMELKTAGGLPLWMARALSEGRIFQSSFSKYGAAYQQMAAQGRQGGLRYA